MFRLLTRIALAFAAGATLHAQTVLRLDLNDVASAVSDTAIDFTPYLLADETLTIAPLTVDVNPAGGTVLGSQLRATPVNGGALTLGAIYRDSVSASGDNSTAYFRSGLDLRVTGLTAGKRYTLTAWSFDSASTGARVSDWAVVGLNGPQQVASNFTWNGSTLPTADTASRFSANVRADESGVLTLRGRQSDPTTTPQVYLNGVTLEESAELPQETTPVLAVDFNFRGATGAANTQAGFQEFLLNTTGAQVTATARTFGSRTVTLTPIGGSVDDRSRTTPNNSGPFSESLLLRDFVFGTSSAGIDVRIQGLTPNRAYIVELWSFDSVSATARICDWTVNGGTMWDDYTFNGALLPPTNEDAKMVGTFTATAGGELLISGRAVGPNLPAVFLNALRISELNPVPIVDLGRPIISEFLADNSDGITDEDGDSSDWIEIWNTTANSLDLTGWRLTDDSAFPGKWVFPAGVVLPAQARLLVWASGKNRTANPSALHTNFGLTKNAGGYLAFSRPDGSIVSSFSALQSQFQDTSYGVIGTADPLTAGFFRPLTPGGANGTPVPGFVADTTFDIKRGYFTAPFQVQIGCPTPGAVIRYTTDGSEPTEASPAYPGAPGITISTTTVLRARAFAAPLAASNTDTQTYLFRAHVQNQPAAPAGWPTTWGTNSEVASNNGGNGTVPADYEMDPVVVAGALPGYQVTDAIAALPSLSLVLNPDDFHSVGSGIYTNPMSTGDAWERAASIEFLELDGTAVSTRCGVRVHGNSSRRPYRMQKHSFRLAFRDDYGDGRFDYPLFPGSRVKSFNKLILHACFTDGWGLVSWDPNRYRPDDSLSFRDRWMKKSFADMGGAQVNGRFAHLYINGLYWGVYSIGERIEDTWCADHFGGEPGDYDLIAPGETVYVRAGTAAAWDALFAFVNSADLTQQANYEAVAAQVDLADFVDYYLLHIHADSEDWPHHNGYAYRNRVVPGAKWKHIAWDQEITMDPTVNVDRLSNGAPNTGVARTPGVLYQRLKVNPEFRLLFADRARKHLQNNGALSLSVEQARWQAFADMLDKAIVAESARWGDTADATPYGNAVTPGRVFTREADWLPTVANVKNVHFANLHNLSSNLSTISELKAQALYPNTVAPDFNQYGGNVASGFALTMSAPSGIIYFTTDGSDPREAFTGNVVGSTYAGPVLLTQTSTIKARARVGTEWSALTEALFVVGTPASAANLAITELHYDPANADHEFIEVTNYSAGPIDLTGVSFIGVTFTFANGTILGAGESAVIVRNEAAFIAQYGGTIRILGQYSGALDGNGEEIALLAAGGGDIVRFVYNDNPPWPFAASQGARTLVLRAPGADPTDPSSWRSSVNAGGSPGSDDRVPFTGLPLVDGDGDSLFALIEYALGSSDAANQVNTGIVARTELLSVGGVPATYLTFTVPVAAAADDAEVIAELSVGSTWNGTSSALVYLGETVALDGKFSRKWRSAQPVTPASPKQFFRLRVRER